MEIGQVASGTEGLGQINGLVAVLIGQPCWKFRFIYGDELVISFGAKVPVAEGPLKGRLNGEWELVTRASLWQFFEADGSEISNADVERKESERRFAELPELRVEASEVTLPNFDLHITFDDGKRFDVPCCQEDDPEDEDEDEDSEEEDDLGDIELACWELYLPDGRLLSVYPHQRWEVTRYRD